MPTPTEENSRNIADLNARFGAVQKASEKTQEIVEGHTPEIAELKAEVRHLKADRDELRKQLEELKGRLWNYTFTLLLALVGAIAAVVLKK